MGCHGCRPPNDQRIAADRFKGPVLGCQGPPPPPPQSPLRAGCLSAAVPKLSFFIQGGGEGGHTCPRCENFAVFGTAGLG